MRIGHWDRDRISWVDCHHGKNHSCIESTSNSILRSHAQPKFESLLLFCQRRCDIISNLNDFHIFCFSWRWWFGYHTRIEPRTDMHSVHHFKIFFWRGQNTTLNTTTESTLVSSQTCRSSSVVGAPSGRHSRLGPALSAFHSLNDWIFLSHDWQDDIYFRKAMLYENAHPPIFRIVPNDLTVLPDDYRDKDRGFISEQNL